MFVWFLSYQIRWNDNGIIFTALLYSTFHFFAILMNYETVKAERAKQEAQRLNKELQTTQSLLAEASRQSERTRIARDLHDLLGHHLTALSINLQVAERLSEGDAKEKIAQCHVLSKLLLSDVREAVSTLRDNQSLDVSELITQLGDSIPNLTLHSDISVAFSLEQMELTRALLSCIQEAVTNTLKHSGGTEFWVSIEQKGGNIVVSMRDNGRCVKHLRKGNGLTGMRERCELFGGDANFNVKNGSLEYALTFPVTKADTSTHISNLATSEQAL
jgi:signal transduction histidine kinase